MTKPTQRESHKQNCLERFVAENGKEKEREKKKERKKERLTQSFCFKDGQLLLLSFNGSDTKKKL